MKRAVLAALMIAVLAALAVPAEAQPSGTHYICVADALELDYTLLFIPGTLFVCFDAVDTTRVYVELDNMLRVYDEVGYYETWANNWRLDIYVDGMFYGSWNPAANGTVFFELTFSDGYFGHVIEVRGYTRYYVYKVYANNLQRVNDTSIRLTGNIYVDTRNAIIRQYETTWFGAVDAVGQAAPSVSVSYTVVSAVPAFTDGKFRLNMQADFVQGAQWERWLGLNKWLTYSVNADSYSLDFTVLAVYNSTVPLPPDAQGGGSGVSGGVASGTGLPGFVGTLFRYLFPLITGLVLSAFFGPIGLFSVLPLVMYWSRVGALPGWLGVIAVLVPTMLIVYRKTEGGEEVG